MRKFEKVKMSPLTAFLILYINGAIRAPNHWTELATWFGFPHYFNREGNGRLIEGLATEVLLSGNSTDPKELTRLVYVLQDIGTFISEEAQEDLLNQLLLSEEIPYD